MEQPIISVFPVNAGSDNPIILSLKAGYAQVGVTAIHIGPDSFAGEVKNRNGQIVKSDENGMYALTDQLTMSLGTNASLANRHLLLYFSIVRVQPDVDKISVDINLEGGRRPIPTYTLTGTAAEQGDRLSFFADIKFTP